MIRASQHRASIFMAIGFAMLITFQHLFVSFMTYMAGGPEQTSSVFAAPYLSLTLMSLMMPVRVDPNVRPAWWCATFSRQVAVLVAVSVPVGAGLYAMRHTPGLSSTIVDLFIEVLFVAMLATVPKSDAASETDKKLLS